MLAVVGQSAGLNRTWHRTVCGRASNPSLIALGNAPAQLEVRDRYRLWALKTLLSLQVARV